MKHQYYLHLMNRPVIVANTSLHAQVNTQADYPYFTLPIEGEVSLVELGQLFDNVRLTRFAGSCAYLGAGDTKWTQVGDSLVGVIYDGGVFVLLDTAGKPLCEPDPNALSLIYRQIDGQQSTSDIVSLDKYR